MKKQYISPEALQEQMVLDSLLNAASITGVDGEGLEHGIEMGGGAEEGGSDSRRRRDIWSDEDGYGEF